MLLIVALELLGGDTLRHLLRYERAAILADNEWWRVITGHLVHLGPSHMWLNLAALFVGWLLCGDTYSMPRWAILVFGCALGISTAFLIFEPHLNWYVGLSGVLHGLLAAGALALLRMRQPGAWLFVGFLVIKIAWEQFMGPLPFSESTSGGNVVVDAHFYGAISGALLSFCVFKTTQ